MPNAGTPLLWVLRDNLNLTGTKYSCGEGICGSCTVHIDGKAERSCILSIENVENASITTIEGLAENPDHPIFKTWIELEVSQCGYCQPGQIMTLAAMLGKNQNRLEKKLMMLCNLFSADAELIRELEKQLINLLRRVSNEKSQQTKTT